MLWEGRGERGEGRGERGEGRGGEGESGRQDVHHYSILVFIVNLFIL